MEEGPAVGRLPAVGRPDAGVGSVRLRPDAARLMRAGAYLRDVPLVAVTGHDRADRYEEARGAG